MGLAEKEQNFFNQSGEDTKKIELKNASDELESLMKKYANSFHNLAYHDNDHVFNENESKELEVLESEIQAAYRNLLKLQVSPSDLGSETKANLVQLTDLWKDNFCSLLGFKSLDDEVSFSPMLKENYLKTQSAKNSEIEQIARNIFNSVLDEFITKADVIPFKKGSGGQAETEDIEETRF